MKENDDLRKQLLGQNTVDISMAGTDQSQPEITEIGADGQPASGNDGSIPEEPPVIEVPNVGPGVGVGESKEQDPPDEPPPVDMTAPAEPKSPEKRTPPKKPVKETPPKVKSLTKPQIKELERILKSKYVSVLMNNKKNNNTSEDYRLMQLKTLRRYVVQWTQKLNDRVDLTDKDIDEYVIATYAKIIQNGGGTTVATIDHEGMPNTDIENVLEKETHRMVPVIASDEIPSLAHFVGPKTKSFGFVINSQDQTKGGKHWRAVFIDRRSASVCFFDSLES